MWVETEWLQWPNHSWHHLLHSHFPYYFSPYVCIQIKLWPTQHDQVCNALLVAAGVGSIFADILPLISHPNIAYLDGGTVEVWGTGCEADSALHGWVREVRLKLGVKHGDVNPFSVLRLIDPCDLWWTKKKTAGLTYDAIDKKKLESISRIPHLL